jgi:hypothetical protein
MRSLIGSAAKAGANVAITVVATVPMKKRLESIASIVVLPKVIDCSRALSILPVFSILY